MSNILAAKIINQKLRTVTQTQHLSKWLRLIYQLSYRRLFELQSRLLARHLLGELPEYPNFTTR